MRRPERPPPEETLVIHVDRLEEGTSEFERTLTKAFLEGVFEGEKVWTVTGPAQVEGTLTLVGERDVLFQGTVETPVTSACRRCLTDVESDLPASFVVSFVPRANTPAAKAEAKGRKKKDDDDGESEADASFDTSGLDEEPYDGDRIDLAPVLREQLLLALPPIEPLCREDCKGLCTTCGQDLNEKDCGHSQKPADPRWSALAGLKV